MKIGAVETEKNDVEVAKFVPAQKLINATSGNSDRRTKLDVTQYG